MSPFWAGWIVVLTLGNIAFALIILYRTQRKLPGSAPESETTGHVWDGDLRELNKPLPRWWLYLFYLSVAFGLLYLALYPGLGSFRGALGWSAATQYAAEVRQADEASAPVYARFKDLDVAGLAANPDAMRIARNLFAANCSMCHGSDGRGAPGFPNLTASNWQWGRDPAAVEQTIGAGRLGVMPPWKAVLGADGVEQVANYVLSLTGSAPKPQLVAAGREKFELYCIACHGPDAHGTTAVGAPNLADEYWLYGGSLETVTKTISDGRQNQMPAHLDRLGAQKVRLLAAYVLGLATPEQPAAATADHAAGH
jgi:cytochrome c oxidase cbb3-type subunit III